MTRDAWKWTALVLVILVLFAGWVLLMLAGVGVWK